MKKLTKAQKETWDILCTDPQSVDFKKFRETFDEFWLTKERSVVSIRCMETEHIIKCINMLERCEQSDTRAYNGLTKELTRRVISDERWKYEN